MEINQTSGSKNIQLTTKQGLLLIVVLLVLFGVSIFWKSLLYPQSFAGTVHAGGTSFVPFACNAQTIGAALTLPLRPDPQPEGFHEENRALILHALFPSSSSNDRFDAILQSVSWRNENAEEIPMTCSPLKQTFFIQQVRRNTFSHVDRNLWTGSLKTTCQAEGIGEVDIDLEMKNCD